MSFFAAFGETLNSAIENVGNIVAPLDDSFEEDVSFDVNEEDAMLEAIRRPGQEQENGTGELALAADRMIDQQQEEIDYLRNKVQSLAIELANRTDRENILHIKITELTEKVVELEGKGLDSRLSLDKTLIELEETRRRQQVCEMAMVSAELKCHELEDKISLLETDSSKSTDSFSRLNTCSNQILWIVSALTEMSRLLSHLGTIEEKISTPAYSVESILALLDSSTVEDMLTAWGAPSCSGRRGGDELVCTAVKDVFFALGSALRQAHNNRNEWEAIITACENLSARVSDHGSSVPKLNPSSLFYETARVAVNNAIGVVTSELQNKQDALIRLAQEKVFWCDQRDIMIKNNSEKEQLLLAAKKIEQDLKDESKQLCDELISMKSQINELKSGGLGRHIAGNVDESLELEECRRDVKRLSHEVQQLQQVITQLRSAEKSKINPDENEHDQSTYILSLKAEIVSLQTLLVENNEKNGELEKHIALLTASCGDDAATIDRFEREICELRSTANEHANREQSLHASANELTLALMEKEDLLRTGQQALTAVEQRLAIEIQANAQNINELSALKLEVVKLNNEIAFENSNSSATVEANELKNALIQNQRFLPVTFINHHLIFFYNSV